jgi:putative ABC transport system permease protein
MAAPLDGGNQSIKSHVRGGNIMWSWKVLRDRLRALLDSEAVHREIDEELRFHLDMKTEENIRRGMSPQEARMSAEARFGRVTRIKELGYSVRGGGLIETLWQDLRYAIRMLRHDAPFTVVAVLTLALGIGANTAIFSIVNAVLLQPLPFHNAGELVMFYNTSGGESKSPLSPIAFLNLKRNNSVFTDIAALSNKGWAANLTGRGEAERLQGFQVSANLFSLLGVAPRQGRAFLEDEDRPGGNHVVILSHALWQRRFGGDPQLFGQTITLNGDSYTVVGVMPEDFRFFTRTDLWTPLAFTPTDENDPAGYLEVIARRKPGVSFVQASTAVETISREFNKKSNSQVITRLSIPQSELTEEVRPMLLCLMVAVGFVLLIACVNIANLLLARGNVRRRELAVRTALGAGRWRVMRQLLTENLLLAFLGAGIGLLLARWATQFVASGLPEYLADANSRVALLGLDRTALVVTFTLALITSLIFGLVPAFQLSRIDLNEALNEGGRTVAPRKHLRSVLVIAEVALAMVLLVGGGLMIRSFWRLGKVNLGYDPTGVLTAKIDPSEKYEGLDRVSTFYQELLRRVRTIPNIREAGLINSLNASFSFSIDEHPPLPPDQEPSAQINQVSPDYFRVLGIPLRKGRFFNDTDGKGSQPVVIVDETFVQQYFPGEDPIGKHIKGEFSRGEGQSSREIVGVVGSARYWTVSREPFPHMYFSYLQQNWSSMSLVVRAQSGDPMRLAAPIRAELAAIDKLQPIHSFKSMESTVSELVAPQRFTTLLLSAFAVMAAGLAAIGIYGVVSYGVAQRTREIGVRMALGATAHDVQKLILLQGMTPVAIGTIIGLSASVALTKLISGLLFGVKTTDLATLITVTLLLVVIALIANYIPARRAIRVDPLSALRYE